MKAQLARDSAKNTSTKVLISLVISLFLCFTADLKACAIPSIKIAADNDNTSTLQTLTIDRTSITFDPALTALGQATATWRVTIQDNPSGASFMIMRTAFTAGDKSNLADNIRLVVEDGAGQLSFTPNAKFVDGASLSSIGTVQDNLGSIQGSGECRFRLRLIMDARAVAGSGTVGTGLIITGVLNP